MTDESQEHRKPKRWGTGCALILVLSPMLYILTAPLVVALAAWLLRTSSIDPTNLLAIYYKPMLFLCEVSGDFEAAFTWYWELFPHRWFVIK